MPTTKQAAPVHALKRGPGRPRATDIEQRVLHAARELISESKDSGDYTLNQLVERSGVSRAAIYRRWDSVRAVSVAALDTDRRALPLPLQSSGSLREVLLRGYAEGVSVLDDAQFSMVVKRLILGLRDPAIQRSYWERHVARRRADTTALLERAKESGEIRADADIAVVLDLINGIGYYQGVVRGEWGTEAAKNRVAAGINLVCDALGAK